MLAESLYVLGCDVMLEKINIDILQAAGSGESGGTDLHWGWTEIMTGIPFRQEQEPRQRREQHMSE